MSELSHLKWQCRRGVKELDLVLSTYLQQHYTNASDKEQLAFRDLLQYEDPLLFDLLLGNVNLEDKNQILLIEKLQRLLRY